MQTRRRLGAWVLVASALGGLASVSPAAAGAASAATALDGPVPSSAVNQIAAIEADKASRTPAQRKLDSQLIYEAREDRGEDAVNGAPALTADVATDQAGRVQVDIDATVTDDLLARIQALGGVVDTSVPSLDAVRATMPLQAVEALAASPAVTQIAPAAQARTARVASPSSTMSVGSQSNQADVTEAANTARSTFAVDGTGTRVCVLSDGVNSLAASQASGNLGTVTVLPGQAGSGDEGTAMLELIHDIAPGAVLSFATAVTGEAAFAQNIRSLADSGCNIIVDDVLYFDEPAFEDGPVGQAVTYATSAPRNALYFSSAGNDGNKDDGTSGTWAGDFSPGAPSVAPLPLGGMLHDFDPGPGVALGDSVTATNGGAPLDLFWSDKFGASANDYDLFIMDSTMTSIVGSSTNIQSGTQDPFEQSNISPTVGRKVVILQNAGAATRYLGLYSNQGRLAISTSETIHGHAGAAGAIAVAATPASGPFPSIHTTSNHVEGFSSDGPVHAFFNPDGSPITPGVFTAAGGTVRQKPNLTAADGVSTSVGGFNPFFGTSASAPNAAAIAALAKSAVPGATSAQLRAALTNAGSVVDIEGGGADRDSGAGILMAPGLLTALGATPGGPPANTAPVGVADSFSTAQDTVLTVAAPGVLANDTDANSDPLTVVAATAAAHGTATVNANGSFTYTPAAGYTGPDSFTYRPRDGALNGNVTTVSITVTAVGGGPPPAQAAPVGVDDAYNTVKDTVLSVSAAGGVLANDTDVNNDPLTATAATAATHGTATVSANGSFTYTPAAGYTGPDSFTYRPNDGIAAGNVTTVSISVTATSQPPPPPPTGCAPAPFTDVPATNVHAADIDCAFERGLTAGTSATTFSPDGSVTRAAMASFIARLIFAAGATLPDNPPDAFSDDTGSVHELAINQLAALAIVSGKAPGIYDPSALLTRGQMATLLVGAMEYVTGVPLPVSADDFPDDNGDVHEHDINALFEAGLTTGFSDGTFHPGEAVRRDQMASFLVRAFDALVP